MSRVCQGAIGIEKVFVSIYRVLSEKRGATGIERVFVDISCVVSVQ